MIETWFIVAIMLGVHSDGTQDVYIFEQPKEHGHFHSSMECRDFVRDNPIPIIKALGDQYGERPIQRVVCVPEENVLKFVEERDIKDLDARI